MSYTSNIPGRVRAEYSTDERVGVRSALHSPSRNGTPCLPRLKRPATLAVGGAGRRGEVGHGGGGAAPAQSRGIPRAGAARRAQARVRRRRARRDGGGELSPQPHPDAGTLRPLRSTARATLRGDAERFARRDRCAGDLYYPDITVVCGEPQFEDGEQDTLLNPTLLAEILSPSTESYDRGRTFQRYRLIPSFQEYVLIAQELPFVEHYLRQPDDRWVLSAFEHLDNILALDSIGCTLALAEIYAGIVFDQAAR